MALTKPAVIPEWARTGTRTEPTEGRKDSGWLVGDVPPAEIFNWIDGLTGDWLKWLNERFADGLSGPTIFSVLNPNDGTRQLETILAGGIKIGVGLNVGFDGAASASTVKIGDIGFAISNIGAVPRLDFDTAANSLWFDRTNNVLSVLIGSSTKMSVGPLGLSIGYESFPPPFPFYIAEAITGTLGGTIGDKLDISSVDYFSGDTVDFLTYAYRHDTGTTWTTASTYLHFSGEAGAERHGFVRFSGSDVASGDYGILAHVGIGSGVFGAEPALYVDASAAYAHSFLPRTYYGLAGPMSEIGSLVRPWSTIWMRDSTGTDAHINATGSGGPGVLTLEVFDGALTRGRIKLVGSATTPYLDCYSIGYLKSPGIHSAYHTGDTPIDTKGFGFRNASDVWDVTGLFYGLSPTSLRLWKQNRRMLDIAGRSGNIDDVQVTLGRGTGATGATAADLREYSCIAHDYVAGGTIDRGDLVYVSSAADHTVLRTTTGSHIGVIGVALDSVVAGQILRVATSGIVLARTEGAPVTRGDFIVSSGVTNGRSQSGSFGPAVVGMALQSVGASTYFKMQIRFGG